MCWSNRTYYSEIVHSLRQATGGSLLKLRVVAKIVCAFFGQFILA